MAAAIDAFRAEAIAALEGLDMDLRRALEWIHVDRREHWNGEVRRGWDRITQARIQLQQARTVRRVGDHEPACPDEKKALSKAQRRLETAQQKVEAVRRCARAVDEAVNEYRGARTPLAAWLESEAPKAIATLHRMMDQLESYLALQAPGGEAIASPSLQSAANIEVRSSRGDGKAEESAQAAAVLSTEYSVPRNDEKDSKSEASGDPA
jgi:hypothetical protein